jgi:hypothetical protein
LRLGGVHIVHLLLSYLEVEGHKALYMLARSCAPVSSINRTLPDTSHAPTLTPLAASIPSTLSV